METQEPVCEAVPTDAVSEQDGDAVTDESCRTLIRYSTFLAILFWLEAAWAAVFLCWTVVYWVSLPRSYSQFLFSGGWQSSFRLARQTDVWHFGPYLGFIAIVAIILGFAGYAARQARSGAGGTWCVRLVRGARWSQPVLIVLIVESALVVNYNLWLSNLFGVSVPHFPTVALVATLLVAGVLVFWLERGAPTAGRLASLGVAALIIASALVPVVIVHGYIGSEHLFSTFGELPTGRVRFVTAIDCPSANHCVAEGSNIESTSVPARYLAFVGVLGTDTRWTTASLPLPGQDLASSRFSSLVAGGGASIVCPTIEECLGVGLFSYLSSNALSVPVWRSGDGGKRWEVVQTPAAGRGGATDTVRDSAIGCMDASNCVASNGQTAIATSDGGTKWMVVGRLRFARALSSTAAAACPTSKECLVISGVTLNPVCSTAVACVRNGTQVMYETWTTDGGKYWHSGRLDTSQAAPSSLACWSASDCLLRGYSSDLLSSSQSLAVTTDSGSHWRSLRVPGALDGTQQIICLPPDECLAIVGSSVMKTADAGADWSTSLRVNAAFAGLHSISCANARTCVVGGVETYPWGQAAALWTTRDGGQTWKSRPFPVAPVSRGLKPCQVISPTQCAS